MGFLHYLRKRGMKVLSIIMLVFVLMGCGTKNNEETIAKSDTTTKAPAEVVPVEPDSLTRLQQIKDMVGECENLLKSQSSGCSKGSKNVKEDMGEGDPMEFEQTAKKCVLTGGYEVHTGNFSGHEWSNDVTIYMKNGIPFFAFSGTYSEGFATESRIYFKTDGNVLSMLSRENDGVGGELRGNKTIKNQADKDQLMQAYNTWRNDINQMVK